MYRIVLSLLVFAILLVLGVGSPLYAQPGVCTPVIENFPGEAFLIGFGEPGVAYVAQTFRALPGGATDLAIELAGRSGPDDVDFHVLITEVSGSGLNFHPTTVLFESGTLTFNSSAPQTVIHIPLPIYVQLYRLCSEEETLVLMDPFEQWTDLKNDLVAYRLNSSILEPQPAGFAVGKPFT